MTYGLTIVLLGVVISAATSPQDTSKLHDSQTLRVQTLEIAAPGAKRPNIVLSADKEAALISFLSPDEKSQMSLSAFSADENMAAGTCISMSNETEQMAINDHQIFSEHAGHRVWQLTRTGEVPYIAVFDSKGKQKCRLDTNEQDSGRLVLGTESGQTLVSEPGSKK